MAKELTIAELVRNGTMSAEVAATLWAAVDERVSFLTVAVPRFAGKSTTSNAVLAMRPPGVPARYVEGEPEEMERLKRERLGGYLVVAEFSEAPVPGYIWGQPVRRVFETVEAGYQIEEDPHWPKRLMGATHDPPDQPPWVTIETHPTVRVGLLVEQVEGTVLVHRLRRPLPV